MSATKYQPLEDHLKKKGFEMVPMSFEEIERVIGEPLPASARRHRAWWSNNPSNSTITYAWLNAGYKTTDVDMERGRLVFRRRGQEIGDVRSAVAPPPPGAPVAPQNVRVARASVDWAAAAEPAEEPTATAMKAEVGRTSRTGSLFGCLKGALRPRPGVDLTVPADPDWDDEVGGDRNE